MLICINFAFERIHYERYNHGGSQVHLADCGFIGSDILPYDEAQMQ